jgi:hypothetical protein
LGEWIICIRLFGRTKKKKKGLSKTYLKTSKQTIVYKAYKNSEEWIICVRFH